MDKQACQLQGCHNMQCVIPHASILRTQMQLSRQVSMPPVLRALESVAVSPPRLVQPAERERDNLGYSPVAGYTGGPG